MSCSKSLGSARCAEIPRGVLWESPEPATVELSHLFESNNSHLLLGATTLKDNLIKIGAKVVSHGRYIIFQMAEVAIRPQLADPARLRLGGPARCIGRDMRIN